MYSLANIGHDEADAAIRAVREALQSAGKAGVIAVADAHGELVALLRLDRAPLPSINIATNKAFTAARERKATADLGRKVRDHAKGFDISYLGDARFTGFGGGLPVVIDGVCVGAVSVSGLSEEEDEAFAKLGVDAIMGRR
jgi:glc operon protein GlcG